MTRISCTLHDVEILPRGRSSRCHGDELNFNVAWGGGSRREQNGGMFTDAGCSTIGSCGLRMVVEDLKCDAATRPAQQHHWRHFLGTVFKISEYADFSLANRNIP